jgi:cobalt/nickel transport protein
MRKLCTLPALALILVLGMASAALAHFQMVYTPDMLKMGTMNLKIVFTHPAESGHVMKMDKPEAFYSIHKGKKKDLMGALKPITWTSSSNSAEGYEATVKTRGGDYEFILVPAPYYEKSEDIYIQQITKVVTNGDGVPSDWNEAAGLKTEWVPYDRPYALYPGMTFRAVLLSDGKPVPNAEVEIEYMNYTPDMKNNKFAAKPNINVPSDHFITMVHFTDADGVLTFTPPFAGWWGFCALGSGPGKTHKGKELSQDAVIWVQATSPK